MNKSLLVECERCANQQHVERAGRYSDRDFLEVWHEHMNLDADSRCHIARLERDIEKLRDALAMARYMAENWEHVAQLWQQRFEEREEEALPF